MGVSADPEKEKNLKYNLRSCPAIRKSQVFSIAIQDLNAQRDRVRQRFQVVFYVCI